MHDWTKKPFHNSHAKESFFVGLLLLRRVFAFLLEASFVKFEGMIIEEVWCCFFGIAKVLSQKDKVISTSMIQLFHLDIHGFHGYMVTWRHGQVSVGTVHGDVGSLDESSWFTGHWFWRHLTKGNGENGRCFNEAVYKEFGAELEPGLQGEEGSGGE